MSDPQTTKLQSYNIQIPNSLQTKDTNLDNRITDNNAISANITPSSEQIKPVLINDQNSTLSPLLITSLPLTAIKAIGWATYYILTSSIGRKVLATGMVYLYGATIIPPIIPLMTPIGLLTSVVWLL